MSTIRGIRSSDVLPQPGFTATRQENGGYIGRHSFAVLRTAWGGSGVTGRFTKGTPITSLDPDLSFSWSFLKVVEAEVVSEEGDITIVSVTLSGAQGASYGEGGEAPDPTYRLSGQLQDAPLSMHPKWTALSDIANGLRDNMQSIEKSATPTWAETLKRQEMLTEELVRQGVTLPAELRKAFAANGLRPTSR